MYTVCMLFIGGVCVILRIFYSYLRLSVCVWSINIYTVHQGFFIQIFLFFSVAESFGGSDLLLGEEEVKLTSG